MSLCSTVSQCFLSIAMDRTLPIAFAVNSKPLHLPQLFTNRHQTVINNTRITVSQGSILAHRPAVSTREVPQLVHLQGHHSSNFSTSSSDKNFTARCSKLQRNKQALPADLVLIPYIIKNKNRFHSSQAG
ncbi:hypothetical protein ABZP36_003158 [Zizania latifolia]